MKSTCTFNSYILNAIPNRKIPLFFRFLQPRNPRITEHRQQNKIVPIPGTSLEPGHERFTGNGFYTISEQDHELEKLIENRTVMLMTIINR